jgi:coproporphyrinogen III oxidase-like Fe-S oxidoreductase
VRTPERYCRLVEAGDVVEAAGETLDLGQRSWEALVLSLRTVRGVPADVVPDELFDEGLVELRAGDEHDSGAGERAVLTPRGRLLANEVTVRLRP